jgi:hypothetical protein
MEENQNYSWETEPEDSQVVVAKTLIEIDKPLDYHVKVSLVLEGSNEFDWGVVKDTHGAINIIPEDAEVCGTWHVYSEGVFWVHLTTPIEARLDRAIMLFKEMTERRLKEPGAFPSSARRKKGAPRQPKPKPAQEPVEAEPPPDTLLTQMRARIMEGRKSEES